MWEIYKKEFLELARDKRTLIFSVLLPTVIMPLIIGGVVFAVKVISDKAEREILPFVVLNSEVMPSVVEELKKQKNFELKQIENVDSLTPDDIKKAIKDKDFKFALVIPKDAQQRITQGHQVELALHFNNASVTNKIYQRVRTAMDVIDEQHRGKLLARFELDEEQLKGISKPIDVKRVNTADKRENWGERIGGMLPYMLMILILTGCMYPALDLGVGEKERGTLETLLLTPVSRTTIVLAKFLVIFTTGFITVFLLLFSLVMWSVLALNVFALEALQNISNVVHVTDVVLVFLMLTPVAAIFAALLLCVSIYAKNYKEAQNYMSPVMMFSFIPIIFSILPGVQLDSTWAWVPLTNVSLAIKEIVKGTIDYGMMGIIFVSTTLVAGAMLYFCNIWFNRESVLFRS